MTSAEQRQVALGRANAKRTALADLRRRLAAERGALAEVVLDPPDLLADVLIVDVIRLAYNKRSARSLQRLGRLAVRDHINLLMPLGAASVRTREWVAEHAAWCWCSSSLGVRRMVKVTDGEQVPL